MTGLHGRAEHGPDGVTVYLIPGLTTCQRRAVIRRLRQEASRYVGPALPLPQLAVALGLDRVRSAARITGSIVRLHPAVTLLPGFLAAALMSLFVMASAGGPRLATGQRAELGTVAAGPGIPEVVTVAALPAGGAGANRTGLDARHRALGALAQSRSRSRSRALPLYRRAGAWYACSPLLDGPVPAPLPGQLACGGSASRLAPNTAHLPEPRAFAT